MRLGAHGPGFSLNSACATGSHAIGEAMRMIKRDEADVVVAGGTEAGLIGVCLAAFKRMGALSPSGESRPFDTRRDGFVMGEGAGVLVLEREDHAKARGATVYGRIVGYGASSDAYHITQPDPEGRGAKRAMTLGAARRGRFGRGRRLRQRAWHQHAVQLPDRERRRSGACSAPRRSPRPRARSGICSAPPARSRRWWPSRHCVAVRCRRRWGSKSPTPSARPTTSPGRRAEAPGVQLALSNSFGFGGQNACLAVAPA